MEAIVLGIINIVLLAGKFVWDWWSGKKEREKRQAETQKRDKELVTLVLQKVRRDHRESNRGVAAMEDEVDAWLTRINGS